MVFQSAMRIDRPGRSRRVLRRTLSAVGWSARREQKAARDGMAFAPGVQCLPDATT
ncbi:hypothetical protein [Luteimonas sp. FCS-9]|uniref:hypothetical protein n=1 Tax=Luteimonas sp. FCS-9 TaxID=1547516 RepID=UPI000AC9449B|nr:hypothetical protein [Luteimonas sp. FCS-9]